MIIPVKTLVGWGQKLTNASSDYVLFQEKGGVGSHDGLGRMGQSGKLRTRPVTIGGKNFIQTGGEGRRGVWGDWWEED